MCTHFIRYRVIEVIWKVMRNGIQIMWFGWRISVVLFPSFGTNCFCIHFKIIWNICQFSLQAHVYIFLSCVQVLWWMAFLSQCNLPSFHNVVIDKVFSPIVIEFVDKSRGGMKSQLSVHPYIVARRGTICYVIEVCLGAQECKRITRCEATWILEGKHVCSINRSNIASVVRNQTKVKQNNNI